MIMHVRFQATRSAWVLCSNLFHRITFVLAGLRNCCGLDGAQLSYASLVRLCGSPKCYIGHHRGCQHMDTSTIAVLDVLQVDCPINRRRLALSSLRVFFSVSVVHVDHFLVVAMLIYVMTDDFDVALHFLLTKSAHLPTASVLTFEGTVREAWPLLLDDASFAASCALELCFPQGLLRLQAEQFIMEAILVARIMDASRRGLVLTLQAVIDEYLGLWMKRSVPDPFVPVLTRLTHHPNTRRKFGVRLRRTWNLHIGGLRTVTCHDESAAQIKASVKIVDLLTVDG